MEMDYRRTLDVRELRPRLRSDVECHLSAFGAEQCYVLEDLASGRFFRIGFAEYALISLFDGQTSLGEAIAQTAIALRESALSEQEAAVVCRWLLDSGLAVISQLPADSSVRYGASSRIRNRRWLQAVNLLTPRFALFNPDRLLQSLAPVGQLLGSFWFFLIWLTAMVFGAWYVWGNFDLLVGDAGLTAVSPFDAVVFVCVWIVLKFLHEAGHGLICRRFGGRVVEAGILFILLIPLPYVDVTSSWRMRSRWHRIFVAAAGMYLELFAAAAAAVVLDFAPDPVVVQVCRYVIISASVTTVLFNANPLMKFDGYYVLSDILNLPNLAGHGQQMVTWIAQRIFFGPVRRRMSWPEKSEVRILIYGVLAALWRILICVGLAAGAALLLRGAGIVIAGLAVLMWVVVPGFKIGRFFFKELPVRPAGCIRCLVLLGILAAGIMFVGQMPVHHRLEAPAIVDFQPLTEVRSRVRGFIRTIHVSDGDLVKTGQVLISLNNPELIAEMERLSLQIRQSTAQVRQYRTGLDLAAAQIEERNIEAMTGRLDELRRQIGDLIIRSPTDGLILQSELDSMAGRLVVPGQHILNVGRNESLVLKGLIPQQHVRQFRTCAGGPVEVHISGCGPGWRQSILKTVSPRAQTRLPHPAFGAQAGGAITIVYAQATSPDSSGTPVQAAEPHFSSAIEIPPEYQDMVYAGQTAIVAVRPYSESIASAASSWCRRVLYEYLVRRQSV